MHNTVRTEWGSSQRIFPRRPAVRCSACCLFLIRVQTHEGYAVTLWPVLSRIVWPGLLALGLAGCDWLTPSVDAVPVQWYEPVQALVVAHDTGRVRALREVEIQPNESGRVQWHLPVGARVAAGDVLVRLQPDKVDLAREHAEAALAVARDQSRRTQGALAEARDSLIQAKTPEQIKQARMQLGLAQAAERDQQLALARAELALKAAGQALARTLLLAPFAGMVSDIYAGVGEKVSPALPLISLADAASLRVAVEFPLNPQLSVGLPCLLILDAHPDERLLGEIVNMTPLGASPRVSVDVQVPAHAAWPVDSPVKVQCLQRRPHIDEWRSRLVAPKHALRGEGRHRQLWKVTQNHVQRVEVEAGATHGDWVEVQGALRAGDRVVLAPSAKLTDGASVRLR